MTWQCPRCMVTFREDGPLKSRQTFRCEVPKCQTRYQESFEASNLNARVAVLHVEKTDA